MRIPSVHSRSSERADVAMTPMIDVVFLLLVFFVWTASFQIVEMRLPSQLTELASSGQTSETDLPSEDFESIVVRIQQNANDVRWIVNDQQVASLGEVQNRLQIVAEIRRDIPVLIDPDEVVVLGHVLDAFDTARAAGFSNIQFTTRR